MLIYDFILFFRLCGRWELPSDSTISFGVLGGGGRLASVSSRTFP